MIRVTLTRVPFRGREVKGQSNRSHVKTEFSFEASATASGAGGATWRISLQNIGVNCQKLQQFAAQIDFVLETH